MELTNHPLGLAALSSELENIIETASASVVRVDDGSRLTATGIVWSADGVIVTTSHGVERDEDLSIRNGEGRAFTATLVGRDPDTDIAVLKVNSTDLPAIVRAEDASIRVGTIVAALGRPGRSGLHATLGIVCSRTETENGGRAEYLLHTDAELYPGFSGGPLINMAGQMAGMTNLMFGRGKGIALGVPILSHVADALLATGRIQRAYLGVRTQQVNLPETLRESTGLTQDRALLIAQVENGSPAEQGGLMLGDTLLTFNETPITDVETLRRELRVYAAETTVRLRVLHGGSVEERTVLLGAD